MHPLPDAAHQPQDARRLAEIETDLLARPARAEAEGWLGELEGIDTTLTFLRDKRTQAQRLNQRHPSSWACRPSSASPPGRLQAAVPRRVEAVPPPHLGDARPDSS
jgi:hypothetical protein